MTATAFPTVDPSSLPRKTFGGLQPEITDRAELEDAVYWIKWLGNMQAALTAAATDQRRPIDERLKELSQLRVGRQVTTLADREKALRAAVEDYLLANGSEFDQGSNTIRLQHGECAKRDTPAAITYGKSTKAKVCAMLVERWGVLSHLLQLATGLNVRPWLKFKADLDVTAIKKAIDNEEIGDDDLKANGLQYTYRTVVEVTPYE
jgi:hypothetical protein